MKWRKFAQVMVFLFCLASLSLIFNRLKQSGPGKILCDICNYSKKIVTRSFSLP